MVAVQLLVLWNTSHTLQFTRPLGYMTARLLFFLLLVPPVMADLFALYHCL